jgi:hypothetical protein
VEGRVARFPSQSPVVTANHALRLFSRESSVLIDLLIVDDLPSHYTGKEVVQ